jgi:beta-glucosidase
MMLQNTGAHEGSELVQIYLRKLWGETIRPVKELKAFRQVRLAPGKGTQVSLEIPLSELRYYGQQGWEEGHGDYNIMIGRNAEDIIFEQKIEI